jgi:hypothetical protein
MFKNKYGLKFGTDPEFFAAYSQPAANDLRGIDPELPFALPPVIFSRQFGLTPVGGDSKHPVYIEDPIFRVIGDGAAFEINLKGPCDDPLEMQDKVEMAMCALRSTLEGTGCTLYTKPTINFDYRSFWVHRFEEDPDLGWSTIFGCDPDQDAFNVDWLAPISNQSEHPQRYGGGHLHFSGDMDVAAHPLAMVKLLALTVGNYVVSQSPNPKLEAMRAYYYGKPGKYRIQNKELGWIEYRTPSNSWYEFSKETYLGIFEWLNRALYLLKNPREGRQVLESYSEATITAITKADQSLAASILNQISL